MHKICVYMYVYVYIYIYRLQDNYVMLYCVTLMFEMFLLEYFRKKSFIS